MDDGVALRPLVRAVRQELAALGDPAKAPDMQRYMRSELPYRGVGTPVWRPLARRLASAYPCADLPTLLATVRELWHGARYREERYVALQLTGERRYAAWQKPALLPFYRELIVTGAWWDLVDTIAPHRVGPLLRTYPAEVTPVVRAWADGEDTWLRRSAIICQLGSKAGTDTELLTHAVERAIGEREFFLRKGIGWALREYSKTDPVWVAAFVAAHPGLSGLSRREASKYLPA
ncbi:MAG TPA: DNA alkylation repair protein [Pseudonocardiaceae bacterium]